MKWSESVTSFKNNWRLLWWNVGKDRIWKEQHQLEVMNLMKKRSIHNETLDHCTSLTTITIDYDNWNYWWNDDEVLFKKKQIIQYPIENQEQNIQYHQV